MPELVKGQSQYQLNRLPPERLYITANGDNPPTIVAGTVIYFNTTILQSVVFTESVNKTFIWNSGNFPTISDGIWYMWVNSTGSYGATASGSITVSIDDNLNGWYDSTKTKRIICRFIVASSAVLPGSICIMTNNLVAELYTTTTNAPSISGLNIIKDGGIWDIFASLIQNSSGDLKLYINSDTTDANYYSVNGPSYTTGSYADAPLWYKNAGATNNGLLSTKGVITFIKNKLFYECAANNHKLNSGQLNYSIGGDDETTTRTNITSISWALSSGAFVAGSDIRIYKR